MNKKAIYNVVFENFLGVRNNIPVDENTAFEDLIKLYFKRINKENLIINNIEGIYFMYNGSLIHYLNNLTKIKYIFQAGTPRILVCRLDYKNSLKEIEIINIIKDNIYSCVYKAKYLGREVAVKKIKKDQLKEDIKEENCIDEISDEDFKNEIIKFNRELDNMKKCYCENSVEIYDYFDTEKEFIIIMELCDNNLFKELAKTKTGFSSEQIKEILSQLNNAFKKMNEYNIVHRDIKINNVLIKYLNDEKTKFKVLLSDYGVSNQLNSMTGKFRTFTGTKVIMAPEILNGEEYNKKCDLWSLGVNIFQLYTKKPPYGGNVEKVILNQIDKLGQGVLDVIKDYKLKDLLSKLLVKDPNKRISWDEYFEHQFFK